MKLGVMSDVHGNATALRAVIADAATVGVDRCLFGTERPGVGTVKDPKTGRWLDETRFTIEAIDWLTAEDRKKIFEDNAKKLFNLKVAEAATV